MISQQELQGSWNQLTGHIKNKWGQMTDNDLMKAEGNVDKLIGVIQQKTGAARADVEAFIDEAYAEGAKVVNRVASSARQYVQQAGDVVSHGYQEVAEQVQHGYEQAEEMIRTRPAASMGAVFGAGMVTGILLTVLMRSR